MIDQRATAAPPGGSLRVLIVLSALMALTSVSLDMYLPALPALGMALHANPGAVQMTLSAFFFGFTVGQLLWGPVSDRYGRRGPVAVGVLLFVLGSGGCALSNTATQMVGWRVVQALGACAGPVLARAMVRDQYGRERSAQMLSTLMLIMGVMPLLGPLLGGQILAVGSWQGIFWLLVGLGLLIFLGTLTLPETLPAAQRNQQRLRDTFLSYPSLLRNRRLVGYGVAGGFFYGGLHAQVAGTPFAYIDYYHVTPQAYGLLFGVNIVGMMGANFLNVRLVMRLGADRLFRFGTGMAAVAGVAVALQTRYGWGGLPGLLVPMFFYVSTLGFIVANSVAGALSLFTHKAGAASALVGAIHFSAGMLSAASVGSLADGTPWTMGWIIGLSGVGSFITAMLLRRNPAAALRS